MNTAAFVARLSLLAGAGLLLLGPVSAASAQVADAPVRWEAWVGCWTPTGVPEAADSAATPPVTCVVPAGDAAVELVTVVEGRVESRETVRAGERRSIQREGCSGWESVSGSADGRRVYRSSEFACEGGLQRRATGVMAMSQGQWLDVTAVTAGGYTDVQVVRQRSVPTPEALDAASRTALEGRALAVESARLAAAAPVTAEAVVEATRRLDAEAVEAWLVERGNGFSLNAGKIVQLADAGVPERVIDLMVALSYPEVFAIGQESREGRMRETAPDRTSRPSPVYGMGGGYPGYGWGWGGYYPGYYGGYGRYPVVIQEKESEEESRGRAVKGRGYTRGGSSGGSSTVSPSSRPNDSRSGSGSASGGNGSSGSSDRTSTGRTAKPRGGS